MAFLKPQTLTCVSCGKAEPITWVVGIGPNTSAGDGPTYKTLKGSGPWVVDETSRHPFWVGRLTCPDCGTIVLECPAGEE